MKLRAWKAMARWILGLGCLFVAGMAMGQHRLEDYIALAERSNLQRYQNFKAAEVNLLENERQKAAMSRPQVSLIGNYQFAPVVARDNGRTTFQPNPDNPQTYFGYDLAASNGGMYQGLLNVNQQLWNAKRNAVFDAQTQAANRSLDNANALTSHDIAKVVTDQYILCLLDQAQCAYADSMLALMAEQIKIAQKLVIASILKPSDLALLNIEQQGLKGQRVQALATLQRDQQDLNLLANINDAQIYVLPDIDLQLSDTVFTSQYMAKFALDSANAMLTQVAFDLKYKPVVNAYANAGLNAVYAPTLPARMGISAGMSLVWTLYDGKQKGIVAEKTALQLQSLAFARANLQQELTVRRRKILDELASYEARATIAEAQLREYDLLLDDYQKEIIQGQLSAINYVATIKNMMLAKRELLLLRTNRYLLINAYNYWNW